MMLRSGRCRPVVRTMGGGSMTRFVGLTGDDDTNKLEAVDRGGAIKERSPSPRLAG